MWKKWMYFKVYLEKFLNMFLVTQKYTPAVTPSFLIAVIILNL